MIEKLFKIQYGKGLPSGIRVMGGPIAVYGSNGVIGAHNEALTNGNTIIIGRKGSVGEVHLSEKPCWPIDTTYYIDFAGNPVPIRFWYYYFKYLDFGKHDTSTAIPGIRREDIYNTVVYYPPLSEQHRIVEEIEKHFSRLDAAVEALKRAQANLKLYRAAVLKAACEGTLVQTEADRAKEEGREYEPASVLLAKIRAEKERLTKEGKIKKQKPLSQIEADEIPYEIPEGWVWVRLGDVYDVRDGTHDTPKYVNVGYPFVTSKNISSGRLDMSDVKLISESDHRLFSQRSKVEKGDILMAMIGSIGNSVIVTIDTEFSIKNVALFKYYSQQLSQPGFLNTFLGMVEGLMKVKARGGVQPFVSLNFLRNYVFALPPLVEQNRINDEVERRFTIVKETETIIKASLARAERLRQSILKRAFEGKLVEHSGGAAETDAQAASIEEGGQSGPSGRGGQKQPSKKIAACAQSTKSTPSMPSTRKNGTTGI